jgi:hypothetical protein
VPATKINKIGTVKFIFPGTQPKYRQLPCLKETRHSIHIPDNNQMIRCISKEIKQNIKWRSSAYDDTSLSLPLNEERCIWI